MITKELAYEKISGLVERFDEQYDSYKRSDYNETQTRRDFIDPFRIVIDFEELAVYVCIMKPILPIRLPLKVEYIRTMGSTKG